jgi:hypothetical protein
MVKVWFCLLACILISSLIWHKLTRYSLMDCLAQIFRTLTTQQINDYGHIKYKLAFYTFITVWLNGSSFLTKCFLSILLVIYSTQKSVPFVESLEEVCDNNQILIGGFDELNSTKLLSEKCRKSIKNRLISSKNYPSKYQDITDWKSKVPIIMEEVRRDIKSGKVVFFTSSRLAHEMSLLNNRFYISPRKYIHQYIVHQIDINHRYSRQIKRR